MAKSVFVHTDGTEIVANDSHTRAFDIKLKEWMKKNDVAGSSVSRQRTDKHSLVTVKDADGIWAAKMKFTHDLLSEDDRSVSSEFWPRSSGDRKAQLKNILVRIKGHPLSQEILKDIKKEMDFLQAGDAKHAEMSKK